MTTGRRRRRCVLGIAVLPVVLASCGKKDEPPPPSPTRVAEASPTAAPTTTLPPPTTVPTPPPVWRAARWGMTRKEMLAAFPGEAQRLTRPSAFGQGQPGSSLAAGSSDLAIPTYEAEGTKFRVLFGFESDALSRIHLAAAKAGATTCGDLESVLTRKYSAPSSRRGTEGSLRGEEITWKQPDQTIVLSCAGVPNLGFQTVTLDYMAPSPEVAKD